MFMLEEPAKMTSRIHYQLENIAMVISVHALTARVLVAYVKNCRPLVQCLLMSLSCFFVYLKDLYIVDNCNNW